MEMETYDGSICVMTRIFHLIGGKWKPIILHLIKKDINRFGALSRMMPRISKKVLTEQLRELENDNLISRHVYTTAPPHVVVYHLTDQGRSLRVLIEGMIEWGMIHFRAEYSEEVVKMYQRFQSASHGIKVVSGQGME
jgi:DNA-binding HxlR family transcriptional regulator